MPHNPQPSIGERLRAAPTARELSLGEVAGQLGVSAATLSRIENSKQSLDLPVFLELAHILGVSPAAMLANGDEARTEDELISELATLSSGERARIFAAANERSRGRKVAMASLPMRVDSLLQSLDAVQNELQDVRAVLSRQR